MTLTKRSATISRERVRTVNLLHNNSGERETVKLNFEIIRHIYDLTIQKFSEGISQFLKTSYPSLRRLAAGERDITAQELLAFQRYLGFPYATYLNPWAIQSTHSEGPDSTTPSAAIIKFVNLYYSNPIFSWYKAGIYPYQYSDMHCWLEGQAITEVSANPHTLMKMHAKYMQNHECRSIFLQETSDYISRYINALSPEPNGLEPIEKLSSYTVSQPSQKGNIASEYLSNLAKAILFYLKLRTLDQYLESIIHGKDGYVIGRVNSIDSNPGYQSWRNHFTSKSINSYMQELLKYTSEEFNGEQVKAYLTASTSDSGDSITLCDEQGTEATEYFHYVNWFPETVPNPVKELILKKQDSSLPVPEKILWKGTAQELLTDSTVKELLSTEYDERFGNQTALGQLSITRLS